jgi:hypothetical protein
MSSIQLYMSQSDWDNFNLLMSNVFDTQYIRTEFQLPSIEELPFIDRGIFNKGISKTEEHKKNLSLANIGKKATPETKEKLSKHSKKMWLDKNYRENISLKRKQQWENNYSKMIYSGKSQEWIITEPSGEEYKVKNLKNFCRDNNLHPRLMSNVAKGIQESHKGWRCRKTTNS